ncbi:hypothetical protein JYT48_01935 [Mariprofundus ferrooxydans]|nr:hypothetical protein [Mariprofundus ferrooxydans]
MKLTLAMGLQYDNGKEASMFAMSLGQGKPPPLQKPESVVNAAVAMNAIETEMLSVEPVQAVKTSFFLTYNLKGLNDTLIFEQSLLDIFV